MFPELARDDVFRLETRRLWLRWPSESDAPALAALAADRDVSRMTANVPRPRGVADAGRFILAARAANARGAALQLALTLKTFPRKLVGVIGVESGQEWSPAPNTEPDDAGARLGFWLGRLYRGRGLISEAVEAVDDAYFRVTEGDALAALVLAENASSRSILEKAGFMEDGRLGTGPGRHADSPVARFVLRRGDWQASASPGLRPGLASDRALF